MVSTATVDRTQEARRWGRKAPGGAIAAKRGGWLVRLTVNLTERSVAALQAASTADGNSKTDTVNRALQVYALVRELLERGGGSIRVMHPDGEVERIHIV